LSDLTARIKIWNMGTAILAVLFGNLPSFTSKLQLMPMNLMKWSQRMKLGGSFNFSTWK